MDKTTVNNKDFSGQKFENTEFNGQKFVACKFNECEIYHCRFIDCEFHHCDLSLAKIDGSAFLDCKFFNSKAIGINWTKCRQEFSSPGYFVESNLNYCNFANMNHKSGIFRKCQLQEVQFGECNLYKADFSESDLEGAGFHNCDLRKANFLGAKNYLINPMANKLTGAKFSYPEALNLLKFFEIEMKL